MTKATLILAITLLALPVSAQSIRMAHWTDFQFGVAMDIGPCDAYSRHDLTGALVCDVTRADAAIQRFIDLGVDLVVITGDLTQAYTAGQLAEADDALDQLDAAGISYWIRAGDHDIENSATSGSGCANWDATHDGTDLGGRVLTEWGVENAVINGVQVCGVSAPLMLVGGIGPGPNDQNGDGTMDDYDADCADTATDCDRHLCRKELGLAKVQNFIEWFDDTAVADLTAELAAISPTCDFVFGFSHYRPYPSTGPRAAGTDDTNDPANLNGDSDLWLMQNKIKQAVADHGITLWLSGHRGSNHDFVYNGARYWGNIGTGFAGEGPSAGSSEQAGYSIIDLSWNGAQSSVSAEPKFYTIVPTTIVTPVSGGSVDGSGGVDVAP